MPRDHRLPRCDLDLAGRDFEVRGIAIAGGEARIDDDSLTLGATLADLDAAAPEERGHGSETRTRNSKLGIVDNSRAALRGAIE